MITIRRAISRGLSELKTGMLKCAELLGNNVSIGKGTVIYYRAKLINEGKIIFGTCVRFGCSHHKHHVGLPFYATAFTEKNAIIEIGDNCRINGAYIHAKKAITIGNNCVIAANVNIIDSNGHETHSDNRTIGRDEPHEIIIGNNVWIGLNSIILKGTTIGDNCIISAGCTIKGVFPANSIVTGNPIRVVKQL